VSADGPAVTASLSDTGQSKDLSKFGREWDKCVSVLPPTTCDMINYYLSGKPRKVFLRNKMFLNYSDTKMSVAS